LKTVRLTQENGKRPFLPNFEQNNLRKEIQMNVKRTFSAIPVYLIGIITCLVLVTIMTCSTANTFRRGGGPMPEGETADQIISNMKERLNLTEEQEVRIRPIIEEQSEKRREIIQKCQEQGRQGMEYSRNELQELQKTTEEQLGAVLTEEQMEEYRKIQEERYQKMREERPERMRRGGGGSRGW
jgi:Spy/CpxP family protein refolding chaperone